MAARGKGRVSRRSFCRHLLAAAGALALPARERAVAGSEASPCPELAPGVVRWIVPAPPGGGYDQYARLIQPFCERRLQRTIVIENISGAGTILGACRLRDARPDGRTLGLLNAGALLMGQLIRDSAAPHPIDDFTLLGRISRTPQIWATAGDSPLKTMADVVAEARRRPLVFGITEFGANNALNAAVGARLLDLRHEIVPGYQGSRGLTLAAIRGEVDVVPLTLTARIAAIEAGDLQPLLQMASEPITDHPRLAPVPCIGGAEGVAVARARATGRDLEQTRADAEALALLLNSGRLAAAPHGLPSGLTACLRRQLAAALADPACSEAATAAHLVLEFGDAPFVRADLEQALAGAERFVPWLEAARRKVRG